MADKIDGKECRYWFRPTPRDYRKCALRGKNDNCDEIEDCFIKELLRKLVQKEQENKKLKEDKKSLLNIIDDLQKEKNKWVEKYNDLGQDFDQLKRKEQECEELKKANDGILTTIRILAKNNIKLREILTEIKEIANYLFNTSTSQYMEKLELILAKISEV